MTDYLLTGNEKILVHSMYVACWNDNNECYHQVSDRMDFKNCVLKMKKFRAENPSGEYQILVVLDY